MKIEKIRVENLFGIFTHEIALNNDEGVTIITGENGLGKTVILEMIEALFNRNYSYFQELKFDKLIVSFDDEAKTEWIVEKKMVPANQILFDDDFVVLDDSVVLEFTQKSIVGGRDRTLHFIDSDLHKDILEFAFSDSDLRRIGTRVWENKRTGVRINEKGLLSFFDREDNGNLFSQNHPSYKWFIDKDNSIDVRLIGTQRLIAIEQLEGRRDRDNSYKIVESVEEYSEKLSKTIINCLADSTRISSQLDSTYPNRLIKGLGKSQDNITKDNFNQRLKELDEKREMLAKVGLIEQKEDLNIGDIEASGKDGMNALNIYVEDSFKKLEAFDDISKKIEILLDIISKRFKYKKLSINKEQGFVFTSVEEKDLEGKDSIIPITKLSSGEQNELVMFYRLLFDTKPNSLILIDEPEISLHISWQKFFIKDLKEIAKLNKLNVVIATHSPDLIGKDWDLGVRLKGLEND